MESVLRKARLTGLTALVPPDALLELTNELEPHARVISWPRVDIREPESFTALDEAIENLFGYDWLLFVNGKAADFFVRRFHQLGHDTSELDSLRVCAFSEATASQLEKSQIHVDLIPNSLISNAVFAAIEGYAGGREALGRLNFLSPRASAARDMLCDMLEKAEARVDVVTAYRTAANNSGLAQLNALLAGGGIDCTVFAGPSTVLDLAELLDTTELSTILAGMTVFCIDGDTIRAANEFGLCPVLSPEPTVRAIAKAMADHFHEDP